MTPELEIDRDVSAGSDELIQAPVDSPFAEVSQRVIDELRDMGLVFSAVIEAQDHSGQEQLVSQDLLESLGKAFLTGRDFKTVSEQANLLNSLVSKEVRIRAKDGTFTNSQMGDAVSGLVYAPRSRKTQSSRERKGRQVCEYILESNFSSLNDQQIQTIRSRVTAPIEMLYEKIGAYFDGKPKAYSDTHGLLKQVSGIDLNANLSVLKLATFITIVNNVGHPEMFEYILTGSEEVKNEVRSSKYGAIFETATILDNYIGTEENYDSLRAVRYNFSQRRKSPLAKRRFNQQYKKLEDSVNLYIQLHNAELHLKGIAILKPKLVESRRDTFASFASKKAIEASGYITEGLAEIATIRDRSIETAEEPTTAEQEIWQSAIEAETVMLAALKQFMAFYKQNRLSVSLESKKIIEDASRPTLADRWAGILRERKLERKRPLIEQYQGEVRDIDGLYSLTNKKLRERHPDLIKLSKIITDMINGRETADQTSVRELVGLMLGVYTERTGFNKDSSSNSKTYLDDAKALRELSAKLDTLGQPITTKLLKSLNLLDEMIDGGLFDNLNVEEYPELQQVADFIKAYEAEKQARLTQDIVEYEEPGEIEKLNDEPEAEDEVEEDEEDLQPLPIEIIGQAEQEDILVFPPGASSREVIDEYRSHLDDDLEAEYPVQWERIIKVVELRDHCLKQGLEVNFIRTKQASWQKLPFFVLEVKIPNTESSISIIESPVYGNATYTFKENPTSPPWREVVQLTRRDAREWGAIPAVHVDDENLTQHMRKLWDRIISDLTSF